MRAAVLENLGIYPKIRDVGLTSLQTGQVLVRVIVSGLCGSQMQEVSGNKGNAKFLPHLMGHEGCGIVENIGPGVTQLSKGDKVVMHWRIGPGIESPFPVYVLEGKEFTSGKVTTFSEFAIVSENRLTKIPKNTPPAVGALLGCAITTAFGAVTLDAELKIGDKALVVGCGGVGLATIQALRLGGASSITVTDLSSKKEQIARKIGADSFIQAQKENIELPHFDIGDIEKFDVIIETTGNSAITSFCVDKIADGGRMILVGQSGPGSPILINNPGHFFGTKGKTIRSSQGGGSNPPLDIPKYLKLHENGRVDFRDLISHTFELQDIENAFTTLESGTASRVMIKIQDE